MDAVEFLMERKRMCQFNFKGFVPGQRPCGGCPAAREEDGMCMACRECWNTPLKENKKDGR